MNASEVINKIIADGEARAAEIAENGKKELASLNADYDSEIEKYNQESQRLAQKAADDARLRILATARMDAAKAILAAKHRALDAVFDKAKQNLLAMDDDEYKKFISAMIKSSIETGDEVLVIGQNEKRIDDAFIKQVNRELGTGFQGNILLSSEREDISGGFILKRGDISVNVSIEVLMEIAREELETQIAVKLFD